MTVFSYLLGRSVFNSTSSSSSTGSKEIKSMFEINYIHKTKIVLGSSLTTTPSRGTASRTLHIIIVQEYLHGVAFI